MTDDLSRLNNLPVTLLYVDNEARAADQVFVQVGRISETVMIALSEKWLSLWHRFRRPLSAAAAALTSELGIVLPQGEPVWDETFQGTYQQWLDACALTTAAEREYEDSLAKALDQARTALITSAGFVPATDSFLYAAGPWTWDSFTFSTDSRVAFGNGWRRLRVHGQSVLITPLDYGDVSVVLTKSLQAGLRAYEAAYAANVAGVSSMAPLDLIESCPHDEGIGVFTPEILEFSYTQWAAEAERRRVKILAAIAERTPRVWDRFDNLTKDGISFVEIPEEARQDAEVSELQSEGISTIPPKVAATLLATLAR
jgi:hypothetical protein